MPKGSLPGYGAGEVRGRAPPNGREEGATFSMGGTSPLTYTQSRPLSQADGFGGIPLYTN